MLIYYVVLIYISLGSLLFIIRNYCKYKFYKVVCKCIFHFRDILSTPMTLNGAGDNANDDDDDFNPRAEEFPSVNGISTGSINNGDSSENPDDDFDPRAEEKKPPSFATVPAPDTNGLAKAPPALSKFLQYAFPLV